jgi:hypothetical protein
VGDDVLRVDEVSSRSAVDQSLHRHPSSGLDRLQVQRDVQGVSAFDRVDDILLGKLPFPLRAMNTHISICQVSSGWGSHRVTHCLADPEAVADNLRVACKPLHTSAVFA